MSHTVNTHTHTHSHALRTSMCWYIHIYSYKKRWNDFSEPKFTRSCLSRSSTLHRNHNQIEYKSPHISATVSYMYPVTRNTWHIFSQFLLLFHSVLAVRINLPLNSILKLKSTCHYRKATFTRRKRSFRMSHFMIWIWPMRSLRFVVFPYLSLSCSPRLCLRFL